MNIIFYKKRAFEDFEPYYITPQSSKREWMNNIKDSGLYNCLPLKIGNQMGWSIRTKFGFECIWDGENTAGAISSKAFIDKKDEEFNSFLKKGPQEFIFQSHFGWGILTFNLPWLIKTPKGYGIYLRSPTNSYKENILYMDAFVETDWMNNSFTYNIKLLKKDYVYKFEKDEEICSIIPYKIKDLNNNKIIILNINENKFLDKQYYNFVSGRQPKYAEREKNLETITYDLDYLKGGSKSLQTNNISIGCPFKHFKKIKNYTEVKFMSPKNYEKYFSINIFLKNLREKIYILIFKFRKYINNL